MQEVHLGQRVKMNKKYVIIMLGVYIVLFSSLVSAGFYYDATLNYDNGNMNIKSVSVIFSHYEMYNHYNSDEKTYSAKISPDSEAIFSVSDKKYYDTSDNSTGEISGGGIIYVNKTEIHVFIPYEEAREIIIYNSTGDKLDSHSLVEFTKDYSKQAYNEINAKGNSSLNESENESLDTSDNISGDKKENKNFDYYYIIAIVILIIVLLGIIVYYSLSKNPKKRK